MTVKEYIRAIKDSKVKIPEHLNQAMQFIMNGTLKPLGTESGVLYATVHGINIDECRAALYKFDNPNVWKSADFLFST